MTFRRSILVALAAALFFGSFALLAFSRSDRSDQAAGTKRVSAFVPNKPFRNPFPSASEVRLFVETDYDPKGKPSYSKPQGRVLTASQRAELESLISVHAISPDQEFAACFIPHHFFRYIDNAGKVVGDVAVCFCCAGVEQSAGSNVRLTKGQMLVADFRKLKSFVSSLGERTDVQCEGA